jgi:hypothetical protein
VLVVLASVVMVHEIVMEPMLPQIEAEAAGVVRVLTHIMVVLVVLVL